MLPYHLDAVKQIAGRTALRFADEMNARVKQSIAQRQRVAEGLAGLGVEVFPSGANFILFRTRDMAGSDVWEGLVGESVLIRDCSGWPRLTDCLRVTVGTPEENGRFLEALATVLGSARSSTGSAHGPPGGQTP